jgi:hypothetical protein
MAARWAGQGDLAAGVCDPGWDGDELSADRRRGRFRQVRLGQAGSGAGEVERHHGQHQPGGVRGERPRGQVASAELFRSA